MKRALLPILLCIILVGTLGAQFYSSYQFRVLPPSEKWGKEVVISKGEVKNTPKILKLGDKYIIAHDDCEKIKVIVLDYLGNKLLEKQFLGGDKSLFDLNLLTDGTSIYINWQYSINGDRKLANLKLDKDLNEIDKWEVNDVNNCTQISDSIYVVAYEDKIEVCNIISGKKSYLNAWLTSKICGTKVNDEYIITYYDSKFFLYTTYNGETLTEPKQILFRRPAFGEVFFKAAFACDSKNGYLIVDKKIKKDYGMAMLITFPLKNQRENIVKVNGGFIDIGIGDESNLNLGYGAEFLYNPYSVSSGDSARFMIGTARAYGRSERQFDVMEFELKNGQIVSSSYIDNSRLGTTMPYSQNEVALFCNQTKLGQYNVCFTSQNEDYKLKNNKPRKSEIISAILDIVSNLANSIFMGLTIGLKWILPGLLLISIVTILGYKLSNRTKSIIFILICLLTSIVKLLCTNNLFYGTYASLLPKYLSPIGIGLIISITISFLSYANGYLRYKGKLKIDPDIMPILGFSIALFIDSILTQLIYIPFIM